MKTPSYIGITALLLVLTYHAIPQGDLNPPPGAPAPTMKTLDQMEPRTPLVEGAPGVSVLTATGGITISQSGSYYLKGNLAVTGGRGITINASNVTLDLRGFSITRNPSLLEGDGIEINADNAAIYNGQISGSFLNGISLGVASVANVRVRDISVSGCSNRGIDLQSVVPGLAEACTVSNVGGDGVHVQVVRNCIARECGGVAIRGSIVSDCWGTSTGASGIAASWVNNSAGDTTSSDPSHDGIHAGGGTRGDGNVINSEGSARAGDGIEAQNVTNSKGQALSFDVGPAGILAHGSVGNSTGTARGGDGIKADSVSNSRGTTTGTDASADGIEAAATVSDSYGKSINGRGITAISISNGYAESTSGTGLEASNITNSFGRTTSGTYAINTFGAASYCRAENKSAGTPIAIKASIAIACTVVAGGGTVSAPEKHLGTP